jgi:hypothetical protein
MNKSLQPGEGVSVASSKSLGSDQCEGFLDCGRAGPTASLAEAARQLPVHSAVECFFGEAGLCLWGTGRIKSWLMSFARLSRVALCFALLGLARVAAGQDAVFISEFLAANNGPVLDQDGDASDWIEIYNAGSNMVNLAGWRLTDDAANPGKWTFPATNLAAGNYLLVFASGKNRAVAGQQLHTSFSLDNAGEYLALIKPDGVTVAHQYAPSFPPQINGVSYGVEISVATSSFVTAGVGAKWRVPLGAPDMPVGWAATNFNDAAWASGPIGLGYGGGVTNLFAGGPVTNNVAPGKATWQSSTNGSFGPQLAVNGNYTDYTHTLAGVNLPATWEVNLGTNYGMGSIVLQNRTSNQSRLRDITVRILSLDGTTTNFTSALLNPENVLGGGVYGVGPASLSLNLTQLTGGLVLGGRVRVTRTPDPDNSGTGGVTSTSEPDVLSLAEVEVFAVPATSSTNGVFGGEYQTDVGSAMQSVNSTVLLRVPFLIPEEELPELDTLTLSVQYADGFVAYLNGQEIARRNAPASPVWNSAAVTNRASAAALVAEDIDVSAFISQLQEGTNVLAIQGLNATAGESDFLLAPQLTGRKYILTPDRYFATPTPAAANGGGALGLVADTKFSVDRGFYDAPFSLSITSATAGAEIRFTTNGEMPSAVSGTLYTGPIPINKTTAVRAIATKPGWLPSDVDTHTYVFLTNVLTQSSSSATSRGFPGTWPGTTADYAMDSTVVNANLAQMTPALRSLPSVFITSSISNLFDATSGIYTHPLSTGVAWERAVSVEMVDTNGLTEFQENAGLRIQGGIYFRDFSMTQKKSFRVLFKSAYGTGKLHHDLFHEPGAAEEFDGFVLRAGANDGYAWGGAGTTVQFLRDEFGRRLNLALGHPTGHGLFVHLYLNGLYWGLYNLVERPNEDFSATYLGGDAADWDACAAGDYKNGGTAAATRWNNFTAQANAVTTYAGYQALQGNNADGSRNPALPRYFDPANYQDYMIVNIWGGNWDWPNKNFWFGYHTNGTGYQFYMWDFENTMGNSRDRSPLTMVSPRPEIANQWVGVPHYHLKNYAEYQVEFADRVQRYFFNDGLLTPSVLTNRYLELANTVQPAIVAESARWGDDNHTPAYGLNEWLAERDWIVNTYLPQRSAIVLNQFRGSALFPALGAPAFNQWGGAVDAGFNLVIMHTNAAGSIFYTLDGSDPRQPGTGAVGAGALLYAGPVVINGPTFVRARVLNGSAWSPLVEAAFYPPQDLSRLALTEVMYHAPDVGATSGSEFDFLELKNTGTNTLNLSGLKFTAGVTFTFTNGTTLAPGAFCVLVRNAAAFAGKYPGVPVGGVFSGSLDNGGETLTLSHPLGATVFSVAYDDEPPWPTAPDGFGFSLVQKDANAAQAPDKGDKWRASAAVGGSPGADDPEPGIAPVVINEILAHTDPPLYDAIELFNPTATNVNIGGWYLTDDAAMPLKFRIPTNTIIAAGGYVCFDATQFNATPGSANCFQLSSVGDDAYLFSADAAGNLTGYSHGVAFGASFNGATFGRYVNSAGEEFFPLQTVRTLGAANADPRVGPVIISEINYNPGVGGDEFIELMNITAGSVPLFDPLDPANTWKVNGIGFTFPPDITLAAGQTLLLVATDPQSFRAKYGVSNSVPVLGPYPGALDNSGENLELLQPDTPNTNEVPYVTVEAVRYNDKLPWPPGADGTGLSLQRTFALSFGNEPLFWTAAAPTPGQGFGAGDTDGDGLPDAWESANGTLLNVPDAGADPDEDGMTNWQEFLAGTHPNNAADVLQVMAVAAAPTGFQFSFHAISNHTYSVLTRPTLTAGAWSKLADVPLAPTNRMVSVTDPASSGSSRFYRLVTPALP